MKQNRFFIRNPLVREKTASISNHLRASILQEAVSVAKGPRPARRKRNRRGIYRWIYMIYGGIVHTFTTTAHVGHIDRFMNGNSNIIEEETFVIVSIAIYKTRQVV